MSIINDYGFPFTSVNKDRTYSSDEWREYFSRLIHNGLIQNAANECQVKPQAVPNKTVYVDTGVVFINGAMRVLDAPVTLAVAENTSGNPRIDRVVARLNEANRTIEFAVLEGTPAGSPVAPALTRAAGVYELGLADITLANGYSTITATEITDQRWDISLCGASSMTIGVIPPKGLDAVTVQLGAETKAIYEVENVDDALKRAIADFSSYQAFCSNVNATSIDCAFGKNNEELIFGLGRQLAMYSWFKGESKVTYPFTKLKQQQTLKQCVDNALDEIASSPSLVALITGNAFATGILNTANFTKPDLILYDNGDQKTAITGGWAVKSSSGDSPTYNLNDGGTISLYTKGVSSGNDGYIEVGTNNIIQANLYKFINVECTLANGPGGRTVGVSGASINVGYTQVGTFTKNVFSTLLAPTNTYAKVGASARGFNSGNSDSVWFKVKKIWLSTQ